MKNKLLILFLIMSLVGSMLISGTMVFADDDEDEADSSYSDSDSAYVDSLEQGDYIEEQADSAGETAEPEELIVPKTQFADITGKDCEEAVRVLSDLGIVYGATADEYNPDGFTTRGQMASLILRMLNLTNVSSAMTQVFNDVPTSHPNFSDITSAHMLGIVHGNGDGSFTPDAEVSCSEVIKMVVCALGYGIVAESNGGYPSGYYSEASRLDLTAGVELTETPITRGDTAIILYNALSTDIFERTSYGDSESYEAKENDNILTRYLDCGYVEGIVTDNGMTALDGNSALEVNQIKIGDTVFYNDGIDSNNLIGRAVKGYYREEKGKRVNTLIVCFTDDTVCEEMTLEPDDILSSSRENGFFVFDYADGNSQKKISVRADSYIYNGKSIGEVADTDAGFSGLIASLECGSITLIGNNGDKTRDILIIDEYKSYEVQRADTFGSKIYCDDFSQSSYVISLESDSTDIFYNIYNEKGNEVQLGFVRSGDVISFYESIDKTVYRIYVSRKQTEGKIEEISDDDTYVIDGKAYKRYCELPESELALGKKALYLIDVYSNIAAVSTDAVMSENYALLMDVNLPKSSGLDTYPKIRILNTAGEYETLECEYEIKAYNDSTESVSTVKFEDLICTQTVEADYANVSPYMLWYTDNAANFTYDIRANNLAGAYQKRFYYRPWLTEKEKSDIASRKVIYFEKNKDGRIDKIIVPDVPQPYGKLSVMNPAGSYGMIYRSENNIALDYVTPGTIKISPHAVVYQALALDYTEKDYSVAENGVYSINNGQVSKLYLYSVDGGESAGIVLRYYHLPYESRGNIIPVVVSRISRDTDDRIKLYGYSQGREFEAVIKEDTRLVQRNIYYDDILTTSNSSKPESLTFQNRVNGKNLFGYLHSVNNDLDDSAKATKSFYDLYEGMSWPYADEDSINKGDILLVGYNGGEDLCYVEILMRADDGLMQVTRESTDYVGKVTNSNDFAMGVVRGFSGTTASITIHGPGDSWNRRYTTYGDLKVSTSSSRLSDGRFNALNAFFYETHNYEVNYSQCIVWEYDYKRNTMEKLDGNALEIGDTIIIRGSEYAPREVIILRNNPNIPNLADYEAYEAME